MRTLRPHQGQWILTLDEVSDRDRASRLTGRSIAVERTRLPETDADEVYVHDLLGLEAREPGGQVVGRVAGSYFSGAHEVLVLETPDGEVDVPFAEGFVASAAPEQGAIVLEEAWRDLPVRRRRNA